MIASTSVIQKALLLVCSCLVLAITEVDAFQPASRTLVLQQHKVRLHHLDTAVVTSTSTTGTRLTSTTRLYYQSAIARAGSSKAAVKHSTTLAGKLWPAVKKLLYAPVKSKQIVQAIAQITHWQDLVVLVLIAACAKPVAKFWYEQTHNRQAAAAASPEDGTASNVDTAQQQYNYYKSKRFGIANTVTQVAQVALSVYAVDCLSVALTVVGFQFPNKMHLPNVYAKIAYTTYAVRRFLAIKQVALCKFFKVDVENMGRVELLNRFLNGIIVALVSLLLFDWLSVNMGMAVKGLFAFGSVGTLAFTLASQGLVSQLLSGVFLTLSNKMYVGDSVKFGDGTAGKVIHLGWMETILRGGDNVVTRVPNSQLASQKMSNLSRIHQSQVEQTLRFHYEDAEHIPSLLEDIKDEIKTSCPRLITDGSRPFRVFWTNFNEDHLEVVVNTHFNIPPLGDAYWENRQNVLMAIIRAVKKNKLELAQLYSFASMGGQPEWRVIPSNKRVMMKQYDDEDNVEKSIPTQDTARANRVNGK